MRDVTSVLVDLRYNPRSVNAPPTYMPHIEVSQLWGDSLLRVERFSRWRRLTVGPAGSSDFAAAGDTPTVLVDRGAIHSDTGAVAITRDTDVLIDVGDQTFRVRAVPEERRVGGTLFAHVDWFFVGVSLIGLITLVLGTIATLLAIVVFLLFRYLLALFLAVFGMTAPLFLQIPPPPMPVPVIVASAQIAPRAAPAPPLFVRPTPKPVATMVPLPIGDIPMPKRAALRKTAVAEQFAVLQMLDSDRSSGVLGVLRSSEGNEMSGLIGKESSDGVYALGGLRGSGGGGGSAVGIGGLGVRGSGKVSRAEKVEVVAVARRDDEESEEEYEEGGVEGGVAGGVMGGVVGGVIAPPPPLAVGTLSREQIGTTILCPACVRDLDPGWWLVHLARIRRCYDQALIANPALEGTIVVQVRMDPTGRVQHARSVLNGPNPIASGPLDACVVAEVGTMRFRRGSYEWANYPFLFSNGD